MTTKRERPASQSDRTSELLAAQRAAESQRGKDWRPNSAATSKLDRPYDDPNFEYYWFSNAESSSDNPARGLSLGFVFETWQDGPRKGEVVEMKSGPTTMTLMKQPIQYRDQQLAERAAATNRTEVGLNNLQRGEYGAIGNSTGKEGTGTAVEQELEKSNSLTNPLMKQ